MDDLSLSAYSARADFAVEPKKIHGVSLEQAMCFNDLNDLGCRSNLR
jgi:hypothetical protein